MVETTVKVGNKEIKCTSNQRQSAGAVLGMFFNTASAEAKTHKKGFANFAKTEKAIISDNNK